MREAGPTDWWRPRPLLVTGAPRSGTTWLARLLATAPRTGLPGREPMNPRGRQYGLAGTLDAWTELTDATPRQRRALRRAYVGVNPWVMSRYGRRQWSAPMPWTRLVVKDPFAMLSIPLVAQITGAVPVVVLRHPGAVLASYRRMGWSPDLDEVAPLLAAHRRARGHANPDELAQVDPADDVAAMAGFWSALHEIALDKEERAPAVWVSHDALAAGGPAAGRELFARLGLTWSARSAAEWAAGESQPTREEAGRLHNLGRDPSRVAEAWRDRLAPGEVDRVEELTQPVRARLEAVGAEPRC